MKRYGFILAMVALLALASAPAPSRDGSAEAANRALATAFERAWNAHDMGPERFGVLLAEDVDWVNVDAGRGSGRDQVVQGHVRVHQGKFKDSVFTVKGVDVALLKPDIAVVHIAWGITGDRNDDGTPRQPREGLFTWVTVKEGATWKIRASHNTNKNPVR